MFDLLFYSFSDATYKVNEHDYPLILVGGIDVNQKFHLLAFSVTTREETSNYKFLFETLRDSVKKQQLKDLKPDILVADGAGAIAAGFKETFDDNETIIVMCYFHVIKNVKKMMASKYPVKQDDRDKVLKDIGKIHNSHSKVVFDRSIHLFSEKWTREYADFCKYFVDVWHVKHPGWYNGFLPKCPSTNNGTEGFNSALKRNHTYRELMPLGALNIELFRLLRSKSLKYETKNIPKEITIEVDLWITAIDWKTKLNRSISVAINSTKTTYYVPSTISISNDIFLTSDSVKIYNEMEAADFDDFMHLMSSMWRIDINTADFENSTCSCPQWVSQGICKHVIGIGITLNVLQPPANANPQKLRMKTKKMLPQAAAKALNRQPNIDHSDQQSNLPSLSSISPILTTSNPSIQPSTSLQLILSDTTVEIAAINSELNQSQEIQSMESVSRGRKKAAKGRPVLRRSKSNAELPLAAPVQLTKGRRVGAGKLRRSKSSALIPSVETVPQNILVPASKVRQNLLPGTLVAFGGVEKAMSCNAQFLSPGGKWTSMPAISGAKIARSHASYLHLSEARVFISGGVDSQILKKVITIDFH